MVPVLSATIFLVLLARLMRMPAGAWRFIVGGAVLVLAGSQLLPVGTPMREDVRGSVGALAWVGLAALPVLGYAMLIRAIRRRTHRGGERERTARPTGLVLVPEDVALVRDTEAALACEGNARPDQVSVAWREGDGQVAGHARVRIRGEVADLDLLWVAPQARGRGIGGDLLRQAEIEARLRGATGMVAAARTDEAARFLSRRGFRPYAALGTLRHLHKNLA